MGNASKILYRVGSFFYWLQLILEFLSLALSVFGIYNYESIALKVEKYSAEELKINFIAMTIIFSILILLNLIILAFAKKALRAVNDGVINRSPHVIMIIIGLLGTNIFFLFGGIFGLLNEGREGY